MTLAAKEYRNGVAPAGGRVTAAAEVDEARLFVAGARKEVPGLPPAARRAADSALAALAAMVDRAAAPDSVDRAAQGVVQIIAAATGSVLEPLPARAPSVARGAAVFGGECVSCHGRTGRGDGPNARELSGPPPADLADAGAMSGVSPLDIYRKVTLGVPGTAMPAFGDVLSPADRWAVTLYVDGLRRTAPALREGEGLYALQCAGCHGARGAGDGPLAATLSVKPPALSDLGTVARLSDRDLAALIARGRPGTPMPAFGGALDAAAIGKIVAFVRTLPSAEAAGPREPGGETAALFETTRRQLDSAVARRSADAAFDAYLTFEQVETDVRAHNAALAGELEDDFAALRTRAAAGADPAELAGIQQRILTGLERAERLVADRASGANLFFESLGLTLREGFEAILIVGALMAFLAKAGAAERRKDVAWGAWAAVLASLATYALVQLLFEVTSNQREALEGWTMLLATAVLFYVSYWLLSKIEADKWNAFVRGKVKSALSSGSRWALAGVAFLAVYREGFETILFYKALMTSGGAGDVAAVLAGLALGAGGLVVIYVAINRFGMRIPMRAFFAVTGGLLYYMAFVFAGKGVAELQNAGVVGMRPLDWGPRVPFLGVYPTVQSLAAQSLLVLAALAALVFAVRRPARPRAA